MTMQLTRQRLRAAEVRRECMREEVVPVAGEASINPKLFLGLGQDRFDHAVNLFMDSENAQHHLYVTDLSGPGGFAFLEGCLKKKLDGRRLPEPEDICYIYNFEDSARPLPIRFPKGTGRTFQKRLARLLAELKKAAIEAVNSPEMRKCMEDVEERYNARSLEIAQDFGFTPLQRNDMAQGMINIHPMKSLMCEVREEPMPEGEEDGPARREEIAQLTPEQSRRLSKLGRDFYIAMYKLCAESEKLVEESRQKLTKQRFEQVFDTWFPAGFSGTDRFRGKLLEYSVSQYEIFTKDAEGSGGMPPWMRGGDGEGHFLPFEVRVFVDHSETETAVPVVAARITTLAKAIGSIGRGKMYGPFGFSVDHRNLSPGFFHVANGGYLILSAHDVATVPGLWQVLKHMIKNQEIAVGETPFTPPGYELLHPEPIPARLKVVLFGPAWLLHLFNYIDDEFKTIFRIHADVLIKVKRTPEQVRAYRSYLEALARGEGLHTLDDTGVCALIEYAQRLGGGQNHLSTDFDSLATLLREANAFVNQCAVEREKTIGRQEVSEALKKRVWRSNVPHTRLVEAIERGTFLISTSGEAVGQVNGLVVTGFAGIEHEVGAFCKGASGPFALSPESLREFVRQYADMCGTHQAGPRFGHPMRITAQVSPGEFSIVRVDKEAKMAGSSLEKADLIVEGVMRGLYGNDVPLMAHITSVFEQSYGGVDGDSASVARFLANCSVVANLPVRQGIALTGSLNQRYEVQPIGGVNEKIEGFFDACLALGPLDGKQGVIIPHQNVADLSLRDDVVEAVAQSRFNVWTMKTPDDAMQILFGVTPQEFHAAVRRGFKEHARKAVKFYASAKGKTRRKTHSARCK